MRKALWKIAGGDPQLLGISNKESQYSFTIIGILFIVVNLFTAIGFFGLFYGVFHSIITSLFGTLVLGFLVSNIYRLNLISLEPHTLPIVKEDATLFWTYLLRYSTITMLAFFVSKTFEMSFINLFENVGLIHYGDSTKYMDHLIEINTEHLWVWMITALIILLFIIPIYLKSRLKDHQEYFSLKERRDIRIVRENHNLILQEKESILKNLFSTFKNDVEQIEKEHSVSIKQYPKIFPPHRDYFSYSLPTSLFKDPPFNTKLKEKKKINYKSSSDFLSDILKES